MPEVLQAFTTPANTTVITDTQAPPPVLPAPAVPAISVPATAPFIDGSQSYIWSPNNASGQTVTFRTDFVVGNLPILTLPIAISAFYAFAGNETVSVSARLQVVNVLGVIVLDVPLFAGSNLGNPQNVETLSGDFLLAAGVLVGNTVRIRVEATAIAPVTLPYAPANTGRYLGELTVDALSIGVLTP